MGWVKLIKFFKSPFSIRAKRFHFNDVIAINGYTVSSPIRRIGVRILHHTHTIALYLPHTVLEEHKLRNNVRVAHSEHPVLSVLEPVSQAVLEVNVGILNIRNVLKLHCERTAAKSDIKSVCDVIPVLGILVLVEENIEENDHENPEYEREDFEIEIGENVILFDDVHERVHADGVNFLLVVVVVVVIVFAVIAFVFVAFVVVVFVVDFQLPFESPGPIIGLFIYGFVRGIFGAIVVVVVVVVIGDFVVVLPLIPN